MSWRLKTRAAGGVWEEGEHNMIWVGDYSRSQPILSGAGQFGAAVLAQDVSAQDVLAQPQANNAININMRCLSTRGRLMEMTVPTTMLKQLVEDCKQNLEWTSLQFGNL